MRHEPHPSLPRRGFLVLGGAAFLPSAHGAAPVSIGGTGTGLAPVRRALEGLPATATFVPSLGSSGGIKAVAAGALDLALSARRLTDAERAAGLVERELFRTPFVWAVHARVPVARLARAELPGLYAGATAQWPDGQPVRPVLRPDNDSDNQVMRTLGEDMTRALAAAAQRPGMKVAITDEEAIADIERIPGALGSTTLAVVLATRAAVRVPDYEGMTPSAALLAEGRYPLAKQIHAVTRGAPAGAVAVLLQALQGATGQQALARLGCWSSTTG